MMSGGSGESVVLREAFGRWIRGCGLGWYGWWLDKEWEVLLSVCEDCFIFIFAYGFTRIDGFQYGRCPRFRYAFTVYSSFI